MESFFDLFELAFIMSSYKNLLHLDYYNDFDMDKIVRRSASLLKLPIDTDATDEIVKRSRRTPRVANRALKRVLDMFEVRKHKRITKDIMNEMFEILQIDHVGLTHLDTKYLELLIKKFNGGPAGLSTLATGLGEDKQTIEEYIEPYLLQLGFISKTPKGRVAQTSAYSHLKIPLKETSQQRLV